MAEEAKVDEDEEEEDPEKRARELNPELLSACMRNDTEAALALIEQGADPCCLDDRQWSPLIWAASHGNEKLTRLLISRGAADLYKYDENFMGRKQKHSPLHWAAFKGHLKILWILMAPPHSLSHHEQDSIGNTALHQAAAGGSLECVKCLMAHGCDVLAKNNRGHTPNVLCTVPEVQELLKSAEETRACKASGKQFSSTVLRYLCSWSLDVFCDAHVHQTRVFEDPEATEMEKPVTWCNEVRNTIQEAESQLNQALHLHVHMSQLDAITQALEFAYNKPVDCKLVHSCENIKAKLEAEIELGNAMQIQTVTSLEEFTGVHESLTMAIEDAEVKSAEPTRVDAAKSLRRKLMSEASLMRAVQGPQKTTTGHIAMLEELSKAAEAEGANEDLLKIANKLTMKIKSEREVQHRIAAAKSLCKLSSFKDAERAEEPLPSWTNDIEEFETFHEEYKTIVETGEEADISKDLQTTALEQLAQIELLLVEKKQIEEEKKLKDAKKKKGKK
jgi:hypothetical protein